MPVTIKQAVIPITVGKTNDKTVQRILPVSFLIDHNVVPHGKCINEKSITHIAVRPVHPFDVNKPPSFARLSYSSMLPADV